MILDTYCECDRDEEDAEEQKAWRARRGVWEVLDISPELSKEDTVRLLSEQYEQALKQASCAVTFLPYLLGHEGVCRSFSTFAFPLALPPTRFQLYIFSSHL